MDPIVPVPEIVNPHQNIENAEQVSSKKPLVFGVIGLALLVTGFFAYNYLFSVERPPSLEMKGGLQGLTTNVKTGFIEYDKEDVANYVAPNDSDKKTFNVKNGIVYLYSDVNLEMRYILKEAIVPREGMAVMVGYWNSAKNIFVTSQNLLWANTTLVLKDDKLDLPEGIIPANTGFFVMVNKPSIDMFWVKSPSETPEKSFDTIRDGNVGWHLVAMDKDEYDRQKELNPSSVWRYSDSNFVKEDTIDSSKLNNYIVWIKYKEKPSETYAKVKVEQEAKAKLKAEEEAKVAEDAKTKTDEAIKVAEEAKLKAEEEAKSAVEAKLKAEEEAKAAVEAKLKAEEEAKLAIEAKIKAEAEAKAAVEAKAKVEEESKIVVANADNAVVVASASAKAAEDTVAQATVVASQAEENLKKALEFANTAVGDAKAAADEAVAKAQSEVDEALSAKTVAEKALEDAKAETEKAQTEAALAKESADKAIADAEIKVAEALAAQSSAEDALKIAQDEADKAKEDADKAIADAEQMKADAVKAIAEADQIKKDAEAAVAQANQAKLDAESQADAAKIEAEKALAEKTEAEKAKLLAEQSLKDLQDKIVAAELAAKEAQAQAEADAKALEEASAAEALKILNAGVDYEKALFALPFEVADLTANKGTLGGNVTLGGADGAKSAPVHIFENGMYFDGTNDYITADPLKVSWSLKDWSMSVWADENAGTTTGWRGLLSNRSSSPDSSSWITLGTGNSYAGNIVVEAGSYNNLVYLDSKFNPAGKGLNHYVLTHDYSKHKLNLYINGELNGSADITGKNIGDLNSIAYVGKWYVPAQSWNGEIKFPAVYGSELSPEQIKILYGKIDPKLIAQMSDADFVADKIGEYQADQEASAIKAQQEALAAKLVSWYDKAWSYRKSITIDKTKVSADLDNFPVLVKLSGDKNLIDFAKYDGSDILFATADNPKVKLSHEIEKYDGTKGDLVAWVNVPKLSVTTGAKIYMYYGNNDAVSQQNAGDVWGDNYAMIQHMNGNFLDSTKNKNDGENKGVAIDSAGKIGDSASFEAYPDYISVPTSSSLNIIEGITTSAWVKTTAVDTTTAATWPGIISKRYAYGAYEGGYTFALFPSTGKRSVGLVVQSQDVSASVYPLSYGGVNDGMWHLVTGTYDQKSIKIYVDGVFQKELNLAGKMKVQDYPLFIGQIQYFGNATHPNYQYYGLMDEVRVSPKAMSAEFIKTEFKNQNSPETFYNVGSAEKF